MSNADFEMSEGVLTFNISDEGMCKNIMIQIIDDFNVEFSEVFTVELLGTEDDFAVVNFTLQEFTVVIQDNDRKCL